MLAGTLAAAALIYVLAWRNGVSGYRFVLIGIGIAAFCGGLVSYVLTRADVSDVQQALVWITGSLNSVDPSALLVLAVGTALLVPCALLVGRPLGALSLGDDLAAGLGVRPERTRLAVVAVAVALAAIAVAVAGPVSFVAFLAAPIARRLVGRGSLALVPSALLGALILRRLRHRRPVRDPGRRTARRRRHRHRRGTVPALAARQNQLRGPWRLT